MGDYDFDIFVSYRRGARRGPDGREQLGKDGAWVQRVFLPELKSWLDVERPHTRIFDDTQLRTGSDWPDEIRAALQRSRCMLAIWSPPYFQSAWCRSEWHTMLARQVYDAKQGRKRSDYVFPVRYCGDFKYFDDEAKRTQMRDDLYPYSDLEAGRRSQRLRIFPKPVPLEPSHERPSLRIGGVLRSPPAMTCVRSRPPRGSLPCRSVGDRASTVPRRHHHRRESLAAGMSAGRVGVGPARRRTRWDP